MITTMQVNDTLATTVWSTTVTIVTAAIAENCCVTVAKQWIGAIIVLLFIAYVVQGGDSKCAMCASLSYAGNVHILGSALDARKTSVIETASQDTIVLPAQSVSVQIAGVNFGMSANTVMPIAVTYAII